MNNSRKYKISVIMSVKNGMPYLKEAVRSVLNQTYKNFEFIIVDDGSLDQTWIYLKNIKDKRLILLKNKRNYGLAYSLNKALSNVSGNYVARMDADDICKRNRLSIQINYLLKHPTIGICGSWVDLINDKSQTIGEKKYPLNNFQIKKALSWYPPIIHPTMMAKAEVFKKLGGYNPNFDMVEDYELMLRAKDNYQMANIPQKLLLWRLWDKRRSRSHMREMDKLDLKIKFEALKKGYFGPMYFLTVVKKFILTYLLPLNLKIQLAKAGKLA